MIWKNFCPVFYKENLTIVFSLFRKFRANKCEQSSIEQQKFLKNVSYIPFNPGKYPVTVYEQNLTGHYPHQGVSESNNFDLCMKLAFFQKNNLRTCSSV